ncbi:MAG: hypothetical protein NZV14_09620 [Bryobacteraceae bacterium]|nr:hypothetical protein [Bryobacteraceae bacterium]MDW8378410.1 hypothetical protein [Bryobacterales bacterium]
MWPYLVGVQLRHLAHFREVEARLANLSAERIFAGVWLIRSDYGTDAIAAALRALLGDDERFFVALLDEDFRSHNLRVVL